MALAAPRRSRLYPMFAIGRKHPMKSGEVDPRFGHQRSKPSQEVQQLEDDRGGTVPIGRFQFIAYPPIIQKQQVFLRYRRTSDS